MRGLCGILAAALAMHLATAALADESETAGVKGVWLTEGGKSHVKIDACGQQICGVIVWLKEPLDDDGKKKTDRNNPDEDKRARPLVGLPLLQGFTAGDDANEWEGGTIYNPEDGETYKSVLTLLSPDQLKVRGYVGLPLFGKSQIWTRVE